MLAHASGLGQGLTQNIRRNISKILRLTPYCHYRYNASLIALGR